MFWHASTLILLDGRTLGPRIRGDGRRQVCKYDQEFPATTIRIRAPEAEAQLRQEGITLSPGGLLASARHVVAGDITKAKALREGQVVIQDEGSQLVAKLIGSDVPDEGRSILDCCAAPGGKTLAIADQNPNSLITRLNCIPTEHGCCKSSYTRTRRAFRS